MVSVEGAELYFETGTGLEGAGGSPTLPTRGRGPVCLVLCSLGTRVYQRQLPASLGQHVTPVFVDLRGSGRSTGDPTSLTFDRAAADLDAVRSALGVERVMVLGHSILGMLAFEYARRYPARVSHVVTVGTPPSGDMRAVMARSAAFFEEDASDERKQLLRDNLARLPPGATPAQAVFAQTPMRFFDPRFDAAPLFADADARPTFLIHLMGTLAPTWDVFAGGGPPIAAPILLAQGRHDYVVPHVLWDTATVARLPRAQLRLFERSGHQPFVEEPDRFVAVIADWLAETR